ncbi:MAG: hypothetical protein WD294_02810 [Phycisphaeraceae bacterium]
MQSKKEYANGQKVYEQEGEVLTYFFKTGIVKARGNSIDGVMEGEWVFYRESGDLWQVGHFENGQKHGQWIRYDKQGKLEYDAQFANGKLVDKKK